MTGDPCSRGEKNPQRYKPRQTKFPSPAYVRRRRNPGVSRTAQYAGLAHPLRKHAERQASETKVGACTSPSTRLPEKAKTNLSVGNKIFSGLPTNRQDVEDEATLYESVKSFNEVFVCHTRCAALLCGAHPERVGGPHRAQASLAGRQLAYHYEVYTLLSQHR